MASKAIANSLRYASNRGYAASPAVCYPPKPPCLQSAILSNNTFVASLDNGAPLTRITVAFKAGPRYEAPNDIGISHMLRAAAGLTTGKASSFILQRKFAQAGATVQTSGDREFIYYTIETTTQNLNSAMECLNNMVSCPEFRPWELSDIAPRLMYDITALPPQVRAIDLLHKAAFRRGLGNSLFISPKRIGTISSESMQHFAAVCLAPARCAVTVVGDAHEKAMLLAQSLQLSSSKTEAYCEPTMYYGGDMRKEMGGELAHVAIALKGAAAGTKEALVLSIAARALGCGPVTKWGADNTVLGKNIGNIGPYAAAGFNVSYSDAGLFGVVLSVPKDEAFKAVKTAATILKCGFLDENAVCAGKNQLKLQLYTETENGTLLSESLAAQGLYSGKAITAADIVNQINHIDCDTVNSVLSSVSQNKMSIGAAGNLTTTPYVDEL